MNTDYRNSIFENANNQVVKALTSLTNTSCGVYIPEDAEGKSTLAYLCDKIYVICGDLVISNEINRQQRKIVYWFSHYFPTLTSALAAWNNGDKDIYQQLLVPLSSQIPVKLENILEDADGTLRRILQHPDIHVHLKKNAFFFKLEQERATGNNPFINPSLTWENFDY